LIPGQDSSKCEQQIFKVSNLKVIDNRDFFQLQIILNETEYNLNIIKPLNVICNDTYCNSIT